MSLKINLVLEMGYIIGNPLFVLQLDIQEFSFKTKMLTLMLKMLINKNNLSDPHNMESNPDH